MRSWPIQNKEDLDNTKGNLTEWVELMFLETFLLRSVVLLYFLKSLSFCKNKKSIIVSIVMDFKFVSIFTHQNNVVVFEFKEKKLLTRLYCIKFSLVV